MGNEQCSCSELKCVKATVADTRAPCPDPDTNLWIQESNRLGPNSWGQMAVSRSSQWDKQLMNNEVPYLESGIFEPLPQFQTTPQFQTPQADESQEEWDKLNRWLDNQAAEVEKRQKMARDQILQKQKDAVHKNKVEALQAAVVEQRERGLEETQLSLSLSLSKEFDFLDEIALRTTDQDITPITQQRHSCLKKRDQDVGAPRTSAHRCSFGMQQDIEVKSSNSDDSSKKELTEQELVLERLDFYQERFKFNMESIEEEAANSPLSGIPVEKAIKCLSEWVGKKPVRKAEFTLAMIGIAAEEGMGEIVTKKHNRNLFSVLDFDDIGVLHHTQWVSSFPFFFCTKEDFFKCLFDELHELEDPYPVEKLQNKNAVDPQAFGWLSVHDLEKYVIPIVQMLIPPKEPELREELILKLATTVLNAADADEDGDVSIADLVVWSKDGSVSECAVHCLREILGLEGFERFQMYSMPKELTDEEKSAQEDSRNSRTDWNSFCRNSLINADNMAEFHLSRSSVTVDAFTNNMKDVKQKKLEDADHRYSMRKRYSMQAESYKSNTKMLSGLARMSSKARQRQGVEGKATDSPTMHDCLNRFRKHIAVICDLADKSALSEISAKKALKFFATSVGNASLDVHVFMDLTRHLASVEGINTRVTEAEMLDLFNAFDFDGKETLAHAQWVAVCPYFFAVNEPIHDEVFGELDVDDNGELSHNELAKYCTPIVQMLVPAKDKALRMKLLDKLAATLFDVIDNDCDGNVTAEEFEKWFYKHGNVAEHAFAHLEKILIDEMRQNVTSNSKIVAEEIKSKNKIRGNDPFEKKTLATPWGQVDKNSTEKNPPMQKVISRAFSLHDDLDISTCIISRRSNAADE